MPISIALASAILAAPPILAQEPDPQARWQSERLERRAYQQVVVRAPSMEPLTAMPTATQPLSDYEPASVERWTVYLGGSTSLDAWSFAQRVGDAATLEELEGRVRRARTGGWLASGLGVLAMTTGGFLVAASQQPEGSSALSVTGAGVALAGMVGTTAGLRVAIAPRRQLGDVDQSWEPEQADALIDAHNLALRRELGLPPE